MESEDGQHRIMIGHSVFTLPRDIENGRLGWLTGFSSGRTEIVYLGKAWAKASERTNKRIAFFEENGFSAAADDYRTFSFPVESTPAQDSLIEVAALARPDLPRKNLEHYVRSVEAQMAVSKAIVNDEDTTEFLPPLLRHRKAWEAYTAHCIESEASSSPPEWLMSQFLEPLGFDQAVVRGLREDA